MDDQDMDLKIVINKFGLSQVNLCKKNLINVPEKLFLLYKLETLLASENRLTTVPPQIGKLRKLKILDLSHNRLSVLPEALSKCSNLVELYLHDNRISKIPLELSAFRQLRFVQLSDNVFEKLPANIGQIASLERLDISKNGLWSLPKSFSSLINLCHLNLADNVFIDFPLQLLPLAKLERLDISHNKISNLPPDLSSLKSLRRVNVAFNQFSTFPSSLCDLKRLEYLNVSNNHLTSISSRLCKLPHLKVLLVNNNFLKTILDNLPSIEMLNASNNALGHLSVTNMKSLRHLLLSGNRLESVPTGTFDLHELEELHLNDNRISHLSQDVALLNKLRKLDVSVNNIKLVPKVLYEMENLRELNLTGEFKNIKNGPRPEKKVAAYLLEPVQKPPTKQPKKVSKGFIRKLFSIGRREAGNDKLSAADNLFESQNDFREKNAEFLFSGPSQNPKSIMKRSRSLQKSDDQKSFFSRQAWSDETSHRTTTSKESKNGDLREQSLVALKPYYEVEYPRSWLLEGVEEDMMTKQSSIRFQEELPIRFENNQTREDGRNRHASRHSKSKTFKRFGHFAGNRQDSKSLERVGRPSPKYKFSKDFLEPQEDSAYSRSDDSLRELSTKDRERVLEDSRPRNGRKLRKEGRRRDSHADDLPPEDNVSTTVTVNDRDVGDNLSLGDDDFLFHPSSVTDEKLLDLALGLESLLGEQILTPYSGKRVRRK